MGNGDMEYQKEVERQLEEILKEIKETNNILREALEDE